MGEYQYACTRGVRSMNTQIQSFDPALLQKPIKDRLEYFKTRQIDHAMQRNTFNRAVASLRCAAGPKVLVITGPTGVGKTTLGRRLYREIQNIHKDDANLNNSIVPVIGVNAAPPVGASFNWRDFYSRVLQANKDILLDHKVSLTGQSEMFAHNGYELSEGADADKLKRSLESSIVHRKTRYLFIDEAHHILMVKDQGRLEFQFEMLKSLTIESDITIVLMGTYDLLDIRDYSGQLVRRSEILHMGRYDPNLYEHRTEFASTMEAFLQRMPFKIKPDLSNDMEYFFTKSAGCIGILKEWLTRTYGHALDAGMDTFDRDFAAQFALDNKGLRTIIEEVLNGELKMSDEPYERISQLLIDGSTLIDRSNSNSLMEKPNILKAKQRRIGTRNPKRDPVGGVEYAG